ncbi:YadA-like family protein [Agrobacterium pusense]|jgi:autotransporter adhesin|uniref:YadA-like family protein n=1 Tax=Agrobacterium pusense TaxID=648995 RepID=UPI0021D0F555|nr:YadA-like family protein [Agrobacterium pusense]
MELPSSKFAGNTLLKLLISSAAILSLNPTFVAAAPAVSGKNGCIIKYGGAVAGSSGGDNSQMMYQQCNPNAWNGYYDSSAMEFGNFVTANEVNNAFNQIQNEYQNYVNQQISASNNGAKDAEQDGRLNGHDQAITNINNNITNINITNVNQQNQLNDHSTRIEAGEQKDVEQDGRLDSIEQKNIEQDGRLDGVEQKNAEQDGRLDGVEQKNVQQDGRLDGHDRDIAGIKDTGVFYNTDANGNKSGGVTLNDGTGNPVQIGNVAAGKAATDAVNVAQLDSTVAALGGGAKINADGTVQAPVYEVAGLAYNNVGDALKATNEAAVQYVTDGNGKRTNDVVLTGDGSGPVRMHNVADGKADTDAANVRQVKQAAQESKNYTDQRFSELQTQSSDQFSSLSSQIERNLQETRGGIATAMGMAALRFDNNPGKLSFASGLGSFKGATSVVAGMGYTSEDGVVRVNASMGYNFGENDLSWNAGASFTLN